MKLKQILLSSGFLLASGYVFAATPSLNLSGINSNESVNITLKIQNARNIKDVKFVGLDNFQVLSREVNFNTSSDNESNNVFISKYALAPTKAESSSIYVTANIDGKNYTSDMLVFNITKQQLDAFNKYQKQQQQLTQKQMQKMQDAINQQFKVQQQYFDNMNKLMQQQQEEMMRAQQLLFRSMESM